MLCVRSNRVGTAELRFVYRCVPVAHLLQATIIANLKDPDVSIRRRALDLLFTMCDGGAAVEVVEELVRSWRAARGHACMRHVICLC